ncbi:hypothetical protein A5780_31280 [Nocardia sp. 852002-20019_SCH5090214]|nr:hypothetical protein A5780_31280 [Nocardia sp. 852002-20019_SCH5090214]
MRTRDRGPGQIRPGVHTAAETTGQPGLQPGRTLRPRSHRPAEPRSDTGGTPESRGGIRSTAERPTETGIRGAAQGTTETGTGVRRTVQGTAQSGTGVRRTVQGTAQSGTGIRRAAQGTTQSGTGIRRTTQGTTEPRTGIRSAAQSCSGIRGTVQCTTDTTLRSTAQRPAQISGRLCRIRQIAPDPGTGIGRPAE